MTGVAVACVVGEDDGSGVGMEMEVEARPRNDGDGSGAGIMVVTVVKRGKIWGCWIRGGENGGDAGKWRQWCGAV